MSGSAPRTHSGTQIFDGEVIFSRTPRTFVGWWGNSPTPSVKGTTVFKIDGAPGTLTNFKDGMDGLTIRVLGDGVTNVAHNATINTNTGANKLLAAGKMYTFTLIEDVWYEAE